jgi:hypothetical protein
VDYLSADQASYVDGARPALGARIEIGKTISQIGRTTPWYAWGWRSTALIDLEGDAKIAAYRFLHKMPLFLDPALPALQTICFGNLRQLSHFIRGRIWPK